MRIITLLATVIVSAILVGCSTTSEFKVPPPVGRAPPPQTSTNWTTCGASCTVYVQVANECKIDVTPLIVLSGTPGNKHVIVWVIQSSEYVFSTAAGTPAFDPKGSGEFFGPASVHGRTMHVDVTVATPHLSHEYGLNIVKKNGTVCPKYDPYVIE